jgi:hypothetical protein
MDLIRNAPPKPLRGEYRLEQKRLARERKAIEERIMAEAKRRDGGKCRFPRCKYKDLRVETAHLEHRGMGGNPALDRTQRHKLIALCLRHHQAFDSLRTIDIEPITERGTDGPVAFHEVHPETGRMEHVFTERRHGVSETRGM